MADIVKVSILGTMPGGEQWSINPVYRLLGSQDISYTEAIDAASDINALTIPTGLRAVMVNTTLVTGCRVEARTFAGTLETVAEATRSSVVAGSSGSGRPYQSALVISLMTMQAGGRGRGRLYWPATGITLVSDTLRVDPTQHANFLTGAESYLADIQGVLEASFGADVNLCVWSRTGETQHPVNQIRVGDVVDTQRRRRDSLAESYLVTAYDHP